MKRFGVLMLILSIGVAGWSQKKTKTEKPAVLFSVNEATVLADEFEYIYRKNNQGKKDEFTEEKIRQYLELFINFKLKVYEARQRGLDTTKAFKKEFKSYRDELKKPYVASADELDRLVKETYDRLTQEVRASHLLVSVSPDASPEDTLKAFTKIQSLRQRIDAGESFETLAHDFSEDPSAKMNKGDLGYFTALQMVYTFEDAAYKVPPGQVSAPVRTRFGYHLIKVMDKRPASGEVEVSHILLRGNDEKTKNKAFEVYDQWKAGRPWEELCNDFSDDAATKSNGGKLRPFGIGTLQSVPEFEKAAFTLQQPGDVSDPFSSSLGWHLVRLEKKIPLPPFSEMQPTLKRRVGRDERLQITKAIQLSKRKKELGFEENQSVNQQLFSWADTSLQKGRWHILKERKLASETLFTLGNRPTTVGEFYQHVAEVQRPSALPPPDYLQQLLDQFLEEKISDSEDEKLQRENADYRNLLNEYREGILLFTIMEGEVWNKASEDTLGQRGYYDQHREKYKAGERISARVLATADKGFLEKMKAKISRGDTLTEADMKNFKQSLQVRAYEKGDNKAVDQISWAVGLHETEADGLYYLVEVDRLLPAGAKTFDESRAHVISDYQNALEEKWLAELRGKYSVKQNKKVTKAVIARLKSA